jgi:hypothetical protein
MKLRHSNKLFAGYPHLFEVAEMNPLGHDRLMETKRSILKKLSARIRKEGCCQALVPIS